MEISTRAIRGILLTFVHFHGERFPTEQRKIETCQRVGALPLLFVLLELRVVEDEGNPAAKDVHAIIDDVGGVQTAWEGRNTVERGVEPSRGVDIENPQITQSTPAHTAVDDKLRLVTRVVEDGRVRLTRRRRRAVRLNCM